MPENPQFDETGGFNKEPTPPPLSKNQKMAVAGLAVFSALIVVLWAAQLRNNIYGPFLSNNKSESVDQAASDGQALADEQALKNKDTDGDSLSDYDELNIYKTSPYLEDTDGDGLKDGEEIKNSADPNCPEGRTCSGGLLDNSAAGQATGTPGALVSPDSGLNSLTNQNNTLNSLLNQFGAGQTQTQSTNNSANSLSSDQLNALKNIDAASLRQLLLQNGMDKATLDNISDADLMKSYSETFSNGQ